MTKALHLFLANEERAGIILIGSATGVVVIGFLVALAAIFLIK